jgi:hypothetical protein
MLVRPGLAAVGKDKRRENVDTSGRRIGVLGFPALVDALLRPVV